LTNFSNVKQTHESLESGFPKTTFRKTNTAKRKNTFLETKPNFPLTGKCFLLIGKCFSLTGKCFLLTTFSNSKQTQKNLKNNFSKTTFKKHELKFGKLSLLYFIGSHNNFSKERYRKQRKTFIYRE
jgi:hypothetical protein